MQRLALAIRLAAKYREESYDIDSAKKAIKERNSVKFETFYGLSLKEAADKAAEEVGFDLTGTEPIYLLLQNSWNESLDWANTVNKEKI